MNQAVLLGGRRPCNGQRAHGQQHVGGRCRVSGGVVGGRGGRARHIGGGRGEKVVQRTTQGSWAAAFRDNAAVQSAMLSRERRRCNGPRGVMQRYVCILFAHGHG